MSICLVLGGDERADAVTGNAKLQGLTTQLNLTGDKYNIALVSKSTSTI